MSPARIFFLLLIGTTSLSNCLGQIRDGGIDPWNLGKGDWVYAIQDATNKVGGHVNSVTNENSLMLFYKSQGIRYMIVKAATGASLFNACYSFPQFTPYLVRVAHTNGILIFGYNRTYATNTAAEVSIVDYVFNQGADGFVWDAEAEWESGTIGSQGPALAWAQCSAVRSNWPTKFLAHAPFPIISLHSSFPYKEFGYWCDAVMPQIYHFSATSNSQSAAINWSDVNWKNWQGSLAGLPPSVLNGVTVYWTNAIKPLAPINDVYGTTGSLLCEGTASPYSDLNVMEFIDYLSADPYAQTAGGYKGVNFWRTDLQGPGQWAYIKAGSSGDYPGIVNNIVIDDPRATRVGSWTSIFTWSNTTTKATFLGNGSKQDSFSFGTNYLTRPQGGGSSYVQFTPNILVPGDYNVFQWHANVTNASASVPHIITYNGGSTTVLANQQTNSGNWSLLGRFNFATGNSANIRVGDAIAEPGLVAIADGIKLVFIPPVSVPATPTGLSASVIGSAQIDLGWTDNATNETGYVVARGTTPGGPYTDIVGLPANATNYANTGLAADTTYYYVVRATNILGSSTSSIEALATTSPGSPTGPGINSGPQSQTVIAGQDATFSVNATGSLPLNYQWRFGGVDIAGALSSTYTRTNVQPADAGSYDVVITNTVAGITSSPAVLAVNFSLTAAVSGAGTVSKSPNLPGYAPNTPVTLTATPNPNFVFIGWSGDVTDTNNPLNLVMNSNFSVTANFVSTATEIIIDNPDPGAAFSGDWQTGTSSPDKYGGDYRFSSTIGGGLSNAIFRPYIYAAGYYDIFIWYPQGSNRATNAPWTIVYSGGTNTVAVDQTVNGGGWRLIGGSRPFLQGTNAYVSLSNDTGYSGKVVLADAVRFVLVSLLISPAITNQPQDQAVAQGSNAIFTVGSSGTPLNYQWRFNGTNLGGATLSTFSVLNAQPTNAGLYSVVITNVAGTATSSNATLTVVVEQPLPPYFEQIAILPGGGVLLHGTSGPGHFSLEASTNLANWQELTNFNNVSGDFEFVDEETNKIMRFYRAKVMP